MRRAALAVVAVAGLAAGLLVAIATPRGHEPTGPEWVVQGMVMVAAVLLVAVRATGKR